MYYISTVVVLHDADLSDWIGSVLRLLAKEATLAHELCSKLSASAAVAKYPQHQYHHPPMALLSMSDMYKIIYQPT